MTRDLRPDVAPASPDPRTNADPAGTRLGGVRETVKRGERFDSARLCTDDPEAERAIDRLLAIAHGLRPLLRERQQQTEDEGTYAEDLHRRFWEDGFYRMLQPRQLGGLQIGVAGFYRVISEIARGCPSTAWCLCLGAGHALQLASYWPEDAQRRIFGEHGQVVAASSGGGQNVTVTRVEGGIRLSGTWRYCSGSPYSTHFLPLAQGEAGGPPLWIVLDRSQYEVLDDWGGVMGMRGSGSNSIRVDDAFVPDELIVEHRFNLEHDGPTAGSILHGDPEYAGVFRGFAEGEIAAVAVGLARAALDALEAHLRSRPLRGAPGRTKADSTDHQRAFGLALASADAAAGLSTHGGRLYRDNAARSAEGIEPFSMDKSLRIADLYFMAERLAWESIDQVLRAAGSSEMVRGKPLERYARDALTIRTRTDQLEFDAVVAGSAYLSAEPTPDPAG